MKLEHWLLVGLIFATLLSAVAAFCVTFGGV